MNGLIRLLLVSYRERISLTTETGAALHLAQRFRDEGCDLVGFFAPVGERLEEIEVR
jgi:hypothetical protein